MTHSSQLPGLKLTDHQFELPLRYEQPEGRQISVYAREVCAVESVSEDLPWLVFLQGGPGSGAPRPMGRGGWMGEALKRYRLLLLDQRGTARSSRIDATTLEQEGSPEAQAEYLSCFRADSIVRDAEAIRTRLARGAQWTILGQSFGGFCALNYLSEYPEGLAAVMITGGVPPIGVEIDEVYRATYKRVLQRNRRYYERYPEDAHRVRELSRYLAQNDVRLPGGARLTPYVLQLLGLEFGFSDGFEAIHYLLEEAFVDTPDGPVPSYNLLHGMANILPYETNPIFSLLHEALYCEGSASNWSAARVRKEYSEFDADDTVLFSGEMIFPWMFDVFPRLAPLKPAAELLAARKNWPALYDQKKLSQNKVPIAAAVFADDMYVERTFSEAVAERVPNMRIFLTNEWDHNALRADTKAVVFKHLQRILDGQT
ncbi:MAG: alpha/beta fold hydrolase [Halioglobus sp.]